MCSDKCKTVGTGTSPIGPYCSLGAGVTEPCQVKLCSDIPGHTVYINMDIIPKAAVLNAVYYQE